MIALPWAGKSCLFLASTSVTLFAVNKRTCLGPFFSDIATRTGLLVEVSTPSTATTLSIPPHFSFSWNALSGKATTISVVLLSMIVAAVIFILMTLRLTKPVPLPVITTWAWAAIFGPSPAEKVPTDNHRTHVKKSLISDLPVWSRERQFFPVCRISPEFMHEIDDTSSVPGNRRGANGQGLGYRVPAAVGGAVIVLHLPGERGAT